MDRYIDRDSVKNISPWMINAAGGATQATLVTMVGYPFDIVKARLQANTSLGSWQCVKNIIKQDGLLGLYRGSPMPWLSHMLKRPIQYPVSEYLKSHISGGYGYNYLIGGVTAIIGPLFGTPLQVVKVATQTSSRKEFKNSYHFIKSNYQTSGLKGFYRGFVPTLLKDTLFGASFIGHYYTLRDAIGHDSWWKNFASGSIAHCLTWYFLIPIDFVKTNIQRSSSPITIREVIRTTIKRDGPLAFWKGVLPACARTIPVSGIAMTGYEYVRSHLSELNKD